jgi:hypothetical protein
LIICSLSNCSFPFNGEEIDRIVKSLQVFGGVNKSFENRFELLLFTPMYSRKKAKFFALTRLALMMPACVVLLKQPKASARCNELCFERALRYVTYDALRSTSLFNAAVPLALAAARNDDAMADAVLHRLLSVMARVVAAAHDAAKLDHHDDKKKSSKKVHTMRRCVLVCCSLNRLIIVFIRRIKVLLQVAKMLW